MSAAARLVQAAGQVSVNTSKERASQSLCCRAPPAMRMRGARRRALATASVASCRQRGARLVP
eukprot:12418180-Alexandrium_andersonii.AAC.1